MVTGMEKINEAIISKVNEEAQSIIADAEEKAREELEKARKQREARLKEDRHKLRTEAEVEAARILAQASIKARQGLLKAKSEIIEEITQRVKDTLSQAASDEGALKALLVESIKGLETNKARIYVAPKDKEIVDKIVSEDGDLSGKVSEIKEADLLGGIISEDLEGKMRIDNSYETRLEMLLPKILPEISKELF